MANGDDAAAAGMDVVPGTMSVRDGYDEINKTRDYIAQRTETVTPVAKGGTGATTVAGAKTALGIPEVSSTASAEPGKVPVYSAASRLIAASPAGSSDVATKGYVDSIAAGKRSISDGAFGGTPITTPHGAANPVSSAWVAAAIQTGDGRLAIQASARRFKKNIRTQSWSPERTAAFLSIADRLFQLIAAIEGNANGPDNIGWIAEEVIDAGFPELVAFTPDGEPLSINYSMAVVHLHQIAREQENRLAALEGRLAALEAE